MLSSTTWTKLLLYLFFIYLGEQYVEATCIEKQNFTSTYGSMFIRYAYAYMYIVILISHIESMPSW